MLQKSIVHKYQALVAILLASSEVLSLGQSVSPSSAPAQDKPVKPAALATRSAPVWQGSHLKGLSRRAEMYYEAVWGVGEFRLKTAESGELIRFNYTVLDPAKATVLNDKKLEPQLWDAQAQVQLTIPQMEKVGKLRQESTPRAGMTYWMAFSNPTRAVKRGDRVDVVIGPFHAAGLIVE